MGCQASTMIGDSNGREPKSVGRRVLGRSRSARVADRPDEVARNTIGQSSQSQDDNILVIPSSNVTPKEDIIAEVEKSLKTITELKFFLSELCRCLDDESKNIPHPTEYQKKKSFEYSGDKVKEMHEEFKKLMKRQPEDMDTIPQGIRELSKECNAKVKSIETLKSEITYGVGIFQISLVCTGIALPVLLPIVWAGNKFASESAKMANFFCETKLKDIERMNNKIQEVLDKICRAQLDSVMVALETKLQMLVRRIELLPYRTRPIHVDHIYGNHGLEGNTNKVKRQVKEVEVVIDKIETPVLDLVAYMREQI